jgi:hypothetical protein
MLVFDSFIVFDPKQSCVKILSYIIGTVRAGVAISGGVLGE